MYYSSISIVQLYAYAFIYLIPFFSKPSISYKYQTLHYNFIYRNIPPNDISHQVWPF